MVILGIDPGTRRIGYGVIGENGGNVKFLAAGILKIKCREDLPALQETRTEILSIIRKWKPDLLAIEKIYFVKNQKTGIAVAQSRGVILSAAIEKGLPVLEFSPNEIKMGLTGYGLADKEAVSKMIRIILKRPDLKLIDDASDALGIALFGAQKRSLEKRLGV